MPYLFDTPPNLANSYGGTRNNIIPFLSKQQPTENDNINNSIHEQEGNNLAQAQARQQAAIQQAQAQEQAAAVQNGMMHGLLGDAQPTQQGRTPEEIANDVQGVIANMSDEEREQWDSLSTAEQAQAINVRENAIAQAQKAQDELNKVLNPDMSAEDYFNQKYLEYRNSGVTSNMALALARHAASQYQADQYTKLQDAFYQYGIGRDGVPNPLGARLLTQIGAVAPEQANYLTKFFPTMADQYGYRAKIGEQNNNAQNKSMLSRQAYEQQMAQIEFAARNKQITQAQATNLKYELWKATGGAYGGGKPSGGGTRGSGSGSGNSGSGKGTKGSGYGLSAEEERIIKHYNEWTPPENDPNAENPYTEAYNRIIEDLKKRSEKQYDYSDEEQVYEMIGDYLAEADSNGDLGNPTGVINMLYGKLRNDVGLDDEDARAVLRNSNLDDWLGDNAFTDWEWNLNPANHVLSPQEQKTREEMIEKERDNDRLIDLLGGPDGAAEVNRNNKTDRVNNIKNEFLNGWRPE